LRADSCTDISTLLCIICVLYTTHTSTPWQAWIRVKNNESIIIRGNVATSAAIHWHESLGALKSSTYTGTTEYFAFKLDNNILLYYRGWG
jgi:hypothetical protein